MRRGGVRVRVRVVPWVLGRAQSHFLDPTMSTGLEGEEQARGGCSCDREKRRHACSTALAGARDVLIANPKTAGDLGQMNIG